jgi:hypothetical protein
MQNHRTASTGRRRAATLAGSVIVAMGATAVTALPAAAKDAPVVSLAPTVPAAFTAGTTTDGWFFSGGVDFAAQGGALRLSNASTSGVITQLVTPKLDVSAGEPGSGGTYDEFDAQFTVASQTGDFQPGLKIEVAPDSGSGSRTGGSFTLWHNPASHKLEIGAIWAKPDGDTNLDSGWTSKTLAAVDPTTPHTVAISEHLVANGGDVADVSVDGAFVGRVGTYEKYAKDAGDPLGTIDSLLFRASTSVPNGGDGWGQQPAVADNADHGFLVSGISYSVSDAQDRAVDTVAAVQQPTVSSLGFFQDASDTRSKGHNELTTSGLHVWTEDSSSESKAALYHYFAQPIPLAQVGQPAITFADGATGGLPGLQLGIDRDGNGTWDGYLVNEGDLYGHGVWWTNKQYFGVPAGGGYPSAGTLDDYLTANPDAQVLSVGYSLGSGVQGDSTITSITVAGKTYPFHALYPASIAADAATAAYGTHASVTVAVSATRGVPTGTVSVAEGSTTLATGTLSDGAATLTLPADLAVGTHALTVSYTGDADVQAGTQPVELTVAKDAVSFTPSVTKGAYGSAGSLVVTLQPRTDTGATVAGVVATGTVTVTGTGFSARATLAGGKATVALPASLAVGDHLLTVAYSGDANVAAATSQVGVGVPLVTSYLLSTDIEQIAGTTGYLPVAVVPGTATGTITVKSGSTTVGTAKVEDGIAVVAISKRLTAGKHALTVAYSGNGTVAASSATVAVRVDKSAAAVSATWSSAHYGTAAKVTVSVRGAAGAATGSVSVYEGSTRLATKSLASGKATISLPKTLKVGTHKLSLRYSGSSSVEARSVAKSLSVAKAVSRSAARLSSSAVTTNQHATVSVTVTAPGVSVAGKATVVVKSTAGKTITVKATVKAGKASVSLPKLKAGSYKVSVNFAGTSTVRSSVSAAVGLRVR